MWRSATLLWAEPAVKNPPTLNKLDHVIAVLLMALVAAEALFRRDLVWHPVAFCLGCGFVAAFLVRRTRGLLAVALSFGVSAIVDVIAVSADSKPVVLYAGMVVLVLVYSLLRWASGRDALIGVAIMITSFTVIVLADYTGIADTIGGAAILLFAAAVGVSFRYRSVAREYLVDQAKYQERELLARELHDTVAHHVSAIAIQAQAGLVLARAQSAESLVGASEALVVIEREAAQTLAEMRTIVGALRDRHAIPDVGPQRSINDMRSLATNGADSIPIEVKLHGALMNLPPALEAALFRVAQESITNAKRHAHLPNRIEVNVVGSKSNVQLTVTDDGARSSGGPNPPGYGLIGMTERVTLLGGTFRAGPQPDMGWQVHALFPLGGAA